MDRLSLEYSGRTRNFERRQAPRFCAPCAVRLQAPSGMSERVDVPTENISCNGFFFYSATRYTPDTTLACDLVIDSGHGAQLVLHCFAQVVRCEKDASGRFGIGCRVYEYFVTPAAEQPLAAD